MQVIVITRSYRGSNLAMYTNSYSRSVIISVKAFVIMAADNRQRLTTKHSESTVSKQFAFNNGAVQSIHCKEMMLTPNFQKICANAKYKTHTLPCNCCIKIVTIN